MGKRGPARKPTALKVVEGRAPQSALDREPKAAPATEELAPAFELDARGLEIFAALLAELVPMRHLQTADAFMVTIAAAEIQLVEDAYLNTASVVMQGARTRGDHAETVKNPASGELAKHAAIAIRSLGELGLSPASRANLTLPEGSGPRTLENLLAGKPG